MPGHEGKRWIIRKVDSNLHLFIICPSSSSSSYWPQAAWTSGPFGFKTPEYAVDFHSTWITRFYFNLCFCKHSAELNVIIPGRNPDSLTSGTDGHADPLQIHKLPPKKTKQKKNPEKKHCLFLIITFPRPDSCHFLYSRDISLDVTVTSPLPSSSYHCSMFTPSQGQTRVDTQIY